MPLLVQAKVDILYIFLGANDAVVNAGSSGQYVPLDVYAANLEKIIQHPAVQIHKPRIFLINPPPINEYKHDENFEPRSRTAENTKAYADACLEVGRKLGVPVVDLWGTIMKEAGWVKGQELVGSKKVPENEYLRCALRDGLHFLSPAYRLLYDEIIALISHEWPEFDPTHEQKVLPAWENAPPGIHHYN